MNNMKEINIKDEWDKILYSEAWKQYCHEDNIGVKRMQIFMTVQSGLFGVLALIAKPLIGLTPIQTESSNFHIGLIIFAAFMVIIGTLLFFLSMVWRSVTKACRGYLNLRWLPIFAIEKIAQIGNIDLAGLENCWRRYSKSKHNRGTKYTVYNEIEELANENFKLDLLPRFRGWNSIETITWIFQILSILIIVAGILIFLIRSLWISPII